MRITVIRPPLVYGAGAKGNFALLAKAVKRGIPLPFAAIRNHRAFLSVENLSSFILQRLRDARTRLRRLPGGGPGAGLDAGIRRAAGEGGGHRTAAVSDADHRC